MENYRNDYFEFAIKHGAYDEISEMANGRTYKQQVFEDGSIWYEVYGKSIETKEVDVHGIKFDVECEVLKIEYWSTDNASSKYAFDRWC